MLPIKLLRSSRFIASDIRAIQYFHIESNLKPQNTRSFHITAPRQNMLVIGGIGILASAVVAQYSYQLYTSYQLKKAEAAKNPPPVEEESKVKTEAKTESKEETKASEEDIKKAKESKMGTTPGWLDNWFAKRFYDGGFEEKMTKREAALILGVRESTPVNKVKDAHRRILMANHPDRGGSPFIASKVNEAKDLLTKGRE